MVPKKILDNCTCTHVLFKVLVLVADVLGHLSEIQEFFPSSRCAKLNRTLSSSDSRHHGYIELS